MDTEKKETRIQFRNQLIYCSIHQAEQDALTMTIFQTIFIIIIKKCFDNIYNNNNK